ncbi:transcriptional regulator [Pontibacillus halophilus JSM 076056 = DSM 19796]|uniref:Phosphate-specific transport system accessory protein PhoU n=1 Tax=Pontibacillus halophilus JSM 076056 = DSM 19796 TaxID=1385510 RepID=A0A0A5GCE2_9BACI|nr:phosphate signaling complex protein PhoU [Pontibacillus halophilus]KGX90856.1 transcriptional regulator [Pontibacillus halophilus JSM 076056 = DSM 19796]
MVTRGQFHDDVENLKEEIRVLADMSIKALDMAVDALYHQDLEQAQKVMDDDVYIDQAELTLNEHAITLIARQQPVATDLRRLIVALKVSSDLERMADNASNIAKSTLHLGKQHNVTVHPLLRKMASRSREMLDLAIRAFEQEDVQMARKLSSMDNEVDEMYGIVTRDLLEETASQPNKVQYIVQMAYSARYIERFADHITNIGENIFYVVKGVSYDLNG